MATASSGLAAVNVGTEGMPSGFQYLLGLDLGKDRSAAMLGVLDNLRGDGAGLDCDLRRRGIRNARDQEVAPPLENSHM